MNLANGKHPLIVKTLHWQDETNTAAFACNLALKPGLLQAVVQLEGDLGTGKTTFARYLLQALGVEGRIKSPTYTVVEPYRANQSNPSGSQALDIWHFDFYRFNSPEEWEEAGFRDIFASKGLKLVEWAEKAGAYQPLADLEIALQCPLSQALEPAPGQASETSRLVKLSAYTPLGKELIE